jgi:hypothetical protein
MPQTASIIFLDRLVITLLPSPRAPTATIIGTSARPNETVFDRAGADLDAYAGSIQDIRHQNCFESAGLSLTQPSRIKRETTATQFVCFQSADGLDQLP